MVQTLDLIRRTFGWTGAANASTSVQRDNGSIARTNLATDPLATVPGNFGRSGSANASIVSSTSTAAEGREGRTALKQVATSTGSTGAKVPVAPITLAAGDRVSWWFWVKPTRDGSITMYADASKVSDGSYAAIGQGATSVQNVRGGVWNKVGGTGIANLDITVPSFGGYALAVQQGDTVLYGDWVVEVGTSDGDFFYGGSAPVALVGGDVVPLTSTLSTLNGSSVPLMLIQFAGARTAQHIVHEILGRSDPDVTFMPTQTRAGTLTFLYESLDAVAAARDLLALPGPVTLTQTDMPALSMTFVVVGDLEVAPDQQDPYLWTIAVPFREAVA